MMFKLQMKTEYELAHQIRMRLMYSGNMVLRDLLSSIIMLQIAIIHFIHLPVICIYF